jgi:large subunit ribosomal protein L18
MTLSLPYRRKREGRTNYKKRLILLKSRKPRLVVRRTNAAIIIQIITYTPDGDRVIMGASSLELKKRGWPYGTKSVPAAYLTGRLLVHKLKEKKLGVTEAIVDTGIHTTMPGGRIFAAVKGAIDAGLAVPADKDIFPSDDRIAGKHIEGLLKALPHERQCATYKDTAFTEHFNKIKSTL